jgi:hypothetical protein
LENKVRMLNEGAVLKKRSPLMQGITNYFSKSSELGPDPAFEFHLVTFEVLSNKKGEGKSTENAQQRLFLRFE